MCVHIHKQIVAAKCEAASSRTSSGLQGCPIQCVFVSQGCPLKRRWAQIATQLTAPYDSRQNYDVPGTHRFHWKNGPCPEKKHGSPPKRRPRREKKHGSPPKRRPRREKKHWTPQKNAIRMISRSHVISLNFAPPCSQEDQRSIGGQSFPGPIVTSTQATIGTKKRRVIFSDCETPRRCPTELCNGAMGRFSGLGYLPRNALRLRHLWLRVKWYGAYPSA